IEGTRITVYDILDYTTENWEPAAIAAWLRISSDQVRAAIRYIEEHKEEVTANYQKILDRCARGNPPELQARLDAIHAECQARWAEMRRQKKIQEANGEGNPGGH